MCNPNGSENNDCNVLTGHCECKTNFIGGVNCDECVEGYFGFPNCQGKYLCSFKNKYLFPFRHTDSNTT